MVADAGQRVDGLGGEERAAVGDCLEREESVRLRALGREPSE